ncbi:Golgi-associated plant pathogenesis-related protein 1-like [Glandiceps talaboti]
MTIAISTLLVWATAVVFVAALPLDQINERVKRGVQMNSPTCKIVGYPNLCADGILCFKDGQLCDGRKNCMDKSDEKNCDTSGGGGSDTGCAVGDRTKGSCTNPTGSATCNTGLDDLRQQLLNSHNYYRCLHGLTGQYQMTLSSDLNNYAQQWAEHLATTDPADPPHSDNRGCYPCLRGENIIAYSDASRWTEYGQFTGEVAVADWYSEIVNFNYQTYKANAGTEAGHFTQIIWRESTELGCGVATAERSWGPKFYIVCQYRKAGNTVDPVTNIPKPL